MNSGIGTLYAFQSIWGHWAGGPGDSKKDMEWLNKMLKVWFEVIKDKESDMAALEAKLDAVKI
jgi:hypothetical protein